MSASRFDLAIVGAGPAGLATAIRAHSVGLRAVVLERRPASAPIQEKACGEGIMPEGVAALARMGVEFGWSESRSFSGIRYAEGGLSAVGRFPAAAGPGRGVRRTVLSRRMLDRAAELGVEVRFDRRVADWSVEPGGVHVDDVSARCLVGADGLHSFVRRRSGLALETSQKPTSSETRRFGVRRHFEVEPWSDLVEVHLVDRAEAYVTPVAPDVVGVAVLFEAPAAAASATGHASFESLLARFPEVERRLRGVTALDEARGAGPLRQRTSRVVDPPGRVALVGDAAGYVDALTGQGLELAFAQAEALVDVVRAEASLSAYAAAHRRVTRGYRIGTRILLSLTRHGPVRRGLVRTLAASPRLFDRAVAAL